MVFALHDTDSKNLHCRHVQANALSLTYFQMSFKKRGGGGGLCAYKTGKTGKIGQTGKTGFMYCNKKLEITRIERRKYCVFFRCDSKN